MPPALAQTNPSPLCLYRRGGCSIRNPSGSDRRTQTHARRTRSKLGRHPCTRQVIVRVPESNNKYGGKGEKTGAPRLVLCAQLSVSPEGFPSEKVSPRRGKGGFVPLFTGQPCTCSKGLLFRRLNLANGPPLPCPDERWSLCPGDGKLAHRFQGSQYLCELVCRADLHARGRRAGDPIIRQPIEMPAALRCQNVNRIRHWI
jgi:hypothetical protein